MSLSVGWTKLKDSLETLEARWHALLDRWDDPVRRDFEEHYWVPIDPQVQATLRAMDRLGQVLARLREECR